MKSLFESSTVLDSVQALDTNDRETAEEIGLKKDVQFISAKHSIKEYTRGFRSFCQSLISYLQSCQVTDEKIIIGGLNLFERIVNSDVTEKFEKKDGKDQVDWELNSKK